MLKRLFKTPAFQAFAVAFGVIAALGAGKVLYGESLRLGTTVTVQQGTVDPTVTAVSAGVGSIYINTSTGNMYQKTDSGSSTNWRTIGVSAAITAPVAFTPTIGAGAGTVTNNSAYYQQIGNNLRVYGSFTAGTVAGSLVSIALPGSLTLDTSRISTNNTTSNPGMSVGRYTQNGGSGNYNGPIVTATGTSTSFVYFGANDSAATSLTPANGSNNLTSSNSVSYDFIVPVSGLASVVNVAQAAIITDWQSYTPVFTSLGTVTNIAVYYRQVGNTFEIQGSFTTGSADGSEARMSLPGSFTTSASLPSLGVVGVVTKGLSASGYFGTYILAEPSVGYLTFGQQSTSIDAATKAVGTTVGSSVVVKFWASVPIAGLGGTIPAPSVGFVTGGSPSVQERIERANVNCDGGSAINSQSGAWLSSIGNISGGQCAISFAAGVFSAAPTCVGSVTSTADGAIGFQSVSSSGVNITCYAAAGSGASCSSFDANVICMGPR